jgi:hypothetical protein
MDSIKTKQKERKVVLRTFWSECTRISVFFLLWERDKSLVRGGGDERRYMLDQ